MCINNIQNVDKKVIFPGRIGLIVTTITKVLIINNGFYITDITAVFFYASPKNKDHNIK